MYLECGVGGCTYGLISYCPPRMISVQVIRNCASNPQMGRFVPSGWSQLPRSQMGRNSMFIGWVVTRYFLDITEGKIRERAFQLAIQSTNSSALKYAKLSKHFLCGWWYKEYYNKHVVSLTMVISRAQLQEIAI